MSGYTLGFNINAGMKMIGSKFPEATGEIHGNVDRRGEIILPECWLGPDRSHQVKYIQQYKEITEGHTSILVNSSTSLIKEGTYIRNFEG